MKPPRREPVPVGDVLGVATERMKAPIDPRNIRCADDIWSLDLNGLVAYLMTFEGSAFGYNETFWLRRFLKLRQFYGLGKALWFFRDRLVLAHKANGPFASSKDLTPIDNVPAFLNSEIEKAAPGPAGRIIWFPRVRASR